MLGKTLRSRAEQVAGQSPATKAVASQKSDSVWPIHSVSESWNGQLNIDGLRSFSHEQNPSGIIDLCGQPQAVEFGLRSTSRFPLAIGILVGFVTVCPKAYAMLLVGSYPKLVRKGLYKST